MSSKLIFLKPTSKENIRNSTKDNISEKEKCIPQQLKPYVQILTKEGSLTFFMAAARCH